MDNKIQSIKEMLVDEQVSNIGRVSNMLWIGFGPILKHEDYKGNVIMRSSVTLHVQSTWRIINNNKILIAFSDFYTPNSKIKSSLNFEWSDFKWDIQGNNLFDEKAIQWLNNKLYVKNCSVNKIGDLKLEFSNGNILEVISDASDNTEFWRIFKTGFKQKHIVMTGKGWI